MWSVVQNPHGFLVESDGCSGGREAAAHPSALPMMLQQLAAGAGAFPPPWLIAASAHRGYGLGPKPPVLW